MQKFIIKRIQDLNKWIRFLNVTFDSQQTEIQLRNAEMVYKQYFFIAFSIIIYKNNFMGNRGYQFTNQKQTKNRKGSVSFDNYIVFYEKWAQNPNFIYQILNQNQGFVANLTQFFPKARESHEDFLEMVFYLQKYGFHFQRSQYAKYNIHQTTLVDRFLMIVLRMTRFEQLTQFVINRDQMQSLFLEIMRLFMPNPNRGFINKLLEFIELKDVQTINVKDYSSHLRLHLPQIQKHLTDYYYNKFQTLQPNGYLLKNFDSEILFQDGVLLAMVLDNLTSPQIKLMYEPSSFGSSFHTLHKNIVGYTGPWLLIVEHIEKDLQGNNMKFRFGAYQNGPISDVNGYQGDSQGFIFSAQPKIKLYFPTNQEGKNYFYLNNSKNKFGGEKSGLGFGGDQHKNNFKIWIDQNLDKSTIYNGHDRTYGFGSLALPSTSQLNISKLEIWGLGTLQDQKNQQQYWETRHIQIQKRRKVNKAQFLKGNVGVLFQNTFAHRQQIMGDFPKVEDQQRQTSQGRKSNPQIRQQQQQDSRSNSSKQQVQIQQQQQIPQQQQYPPYQPPPQYQQQQQQPLNYPQSPQQVPQQAPQQPGLYKKAPRRMSQNIQPDVYQNQLGSKRRITQTINYPRGNNNQYQN